MDLMDRAETLARQTFEDQGLTAAADCLATLRQEDDISQPVAKEDASRVVGRLIVSGRSQTISRRMRAWAIGLGMMTVGALLTSLICWAVAPINPLKVSGDDAVWAMANLIRYNQSTHDLNQFLNSQSPRDKAWVDALKLRGAIAVQDSVGRPVVTWSGVSSGFCTTLVTDLYGFAPKMGLSVMVDGKNVGVSCEGPSHTIVMAPSL